AGARRARGDAAAPRHVARCRRLRRPGHAPGTHVPGELPAVPRPGASRGQGRRTAGVRPSQFEVVRDPLWNNIRLDPEALAVVDAPAVQRLRYVRQLGHAFLVYPGATHSRFEHALGAYHLARRALAQLEEPTGAPLDVDKLDYLSRDAWMCGVPYGVIDVDRLLTSLTLAPGTGGGTTLALTEKGLAPLESLLFAKYQMYRTVYWHHAVRSATAMFK